VRLFKQDALPRMQLVRQKQQQQQQQGQDDAAADAEAAALQRVMDNCLLVRVMAVSGTRGGYLWWGSEAVHGNSTSCGPLGLLSPQYPSCVIGGKG
jgi:hypothetical protein